MKKFVGAVVPDIVTIICDFSLKCKSLYEKLIIPGENVTILKQILAKPHPGRGGFRTKTADFHTKTGGTRDGAEGKLKDGKILPVCGM